MIECTEEIAELEAVGRLIDDFYRVVSDGGLFTKQSVNSELEAFGWPSDMLTDDVIEDLLNELQADGGYEYRVHTVN